jgi:hypothetical protein
MKPEGEIVDAHTHDHEHAHGPHEGHLIELGKEQYHAELVFDAKTRKITVYVLDSEAKNPVAIDQTEITLNLTGDQPAKLTLKAAPQEGDAAGKSSRFEVDGSSVPETIRDEEAILGSVNLKIEGTEFAGEIKHEHEH